MTAMQRNFTSDECSQVDALVTHSGRFHADDLLAYGLLSTLFSEARLVRTRDSRLIDKLEGASIIFDVGDVFDVARRRFDHHQPGRALREDGVPYSSFGLVWQAYGRDFLRIVLPGADGDADEIHDRACAGFVRDIDAGDNGQTGAEFAPLMHRLTLPLLLETLAPDLDAPDPEIEDAAFEAAAAIAKTLFIGTLKKIHREVVAETIVKNAIANRVHPNWIELPRMVPYLDTILASGEADIHYVIGPAPGEWQLCAVRVANDSFRCRKPLPEAWAGLRGAALQNVTGIQDARFCHTGRFIGIAETRSGAMSMLAQAIDA